MKLFAVIRIPVLCLHPGVRTYLEGTDGDRGGENGEGGEQDAGDGEGAGEGVVVRLHRLRRHVLQAKHGHHGLCGRRKRLFLLIRY